MDERIAVVPCSRSNPFEELDPKIPSANQRQNAQQPSVVPEGCDSKLTPIGPANGVYPRPRPCKVLERMCSAVDSQR